MSLFHITLHLIWISGFPAIGLPRWREQKPQLRLYTANDQLEMAWIFKDLENGLQLFHDKLYDPQKPLIFISHGWLQDADDIIVKKLMTTLFKVKFYEKMNIMALDAPNFMNSKLTNMFYFTPATSLESLGKAIANIFNEAIKQNLLKLENMNLLGFSLGAHLSGFIGRNTKGEVHSILGLDPAGPGFDNPYLRSMTKAESVRESDAKFVHLYHTNSLVCGTSQRLGKANFEFNPGLHQPGCMSITSSLEFDCSHKRALHIFIDLILGDEQLVALKCDNVGQFRNCECIGNSEFVLQYPIDTSAEGNYFLKTRDKVPFGLGKEGITCQKGSPEYVEKENMKAIHSVAQEFINNFRKTLIVKERRKE